METWSRVKLDWKTRRENKTSLAKAKKKKGYMQENTEDIKTQSIRSIYTDLGTRQQDIYTVTRQHFPKKKKGLVPKK